VSNAESARDIDALIVGAGISGMYQLQKLRELGLRSRIIERGTGLGGTWFWNRYPGARCDAPSVFYSVSYLPELDQEWTWTERFAAQPEILDYLNEVGRRNDLSEDITFSTSLVAADWDDATATWTSRTDTGEIIRSKYLIMATGCLSQSRVPDIKGLDEFEGRWFHTGRWPHEEVDFTGRRVAVIGTGSTGVQTIPTVAQTAAEVIVLQRTPKFVLPARNAPITEDESNAVKQMYPFLRAEARRCDYGIPMSAPADDLSAMSVPDREALMEAGYLAGDLGAFVSSYADHLGLKNEEVNTIVAEFVRKKIRETVNDPNTAEALIPYGYPIGVNRIIIGTDYYETYNRENVTLHSVLNDEIVEITTKGLRTEHAELEFDDLIFATGYDGMTGSFTSVDIRSRRGKTIKQSWADGPKTYLGMQMADFPNLFLVTGPGGPSVLGNVMTTIEQSSDFQMTLIEHAEKNGFDIIETDDDAEQTWMDHVAEVAEGSLYRYAYKANSWYTGSNVPGKKVVFMPYAGGIGTFDDVLKGVEADGHRGFHFVKLRETADPQTSELSRA
jgi:cation diffusion facilitator CzcD-associated flavoprotein CzcO